MLDIREGKSDPKESQFPEDWIASTTIAVNKGREEFTEDGLSRILLEGESYLLRDLIEKYPSYMVGEEHFEKYGAHTRFLLKFLDSSIRLHLQAHPTIEFAQQHLNSDSGKTEAYVILSVREEVTEPYIYLGFQHAISSEEFIRAVSNQDLDKLLPCFEKIPIQPGDVFIVPGGMPHAIGEGILMIEIMEPTDFAVRLEFERGGIKLPEEARFMGRGVGFAADMINFDLKSVDDVIAQHFCTPQLLAEQAGGREYGLIGPNQTPCFSVNRLNISDKFVKSSEAFYVGIVSKGTGYMIQDDRKIILNEGDRFFVCYGANEVEYIAEGELELVFTYPPK